MSAPSEDADAWVPYIPSNGSEGMDFEARFCERCIYNSQVKNPVTGEEIGCPINFYAHFEADHGNPPQQWRYNLITQHAECTMFWADGDTSEERAERERELYAKAMRGE